MPKANRIIPELTESDKERFWRSVKTGKESECWPWTRYTTQGYGLVFFNQLGFRAHRIAFHLALGNIPDRLGVLHHCDNPPCCNPAHLFAGTQLDNVRDMIQKGRYCRPGHARFNSKPKRIHPPKPVAKLTAELVGEIRAEYKPFKNGARKLGKKFGVKPQTILTIVKRRSWRNIYPPRFINIATIDSRMTATASNG